MFSISRCNLTDKCTFILRHNQKKTANEIFRRLTFSSRDKIGTAAPSASTALVALEAGSATNAQAPTAGAATSAPRQQGRKSQAAGTPAPVPTTEEPAPVAGGWHCECFEWNSSSGGGSAGDGRRT